MRPAGRPTRSAITCASGARRWAIPLGSNKDNGKPKKDRLSQKKNLPREQEDHTAKVFNGQRQIASGALPFDKLDVRSEDFLIECKRTDRRSLGVKCDWLEEVDEQAMNVNRLPAFHFEFSNLRPGVPQRWVMLPESIFKEALDGTS